MPSRRGLCGRDTDRWVWPQPGCESLPAAVKPAEELRKRLPNAQFEFDPGINPAEAVLAARRADIAVVFAIRAEGEGLTAPICRRHGSGRADRRSRVRQRELPVLETGNLVTMPWRDSVKHHGLVSARRRPGRYGIVTGQATPGRLPIT